MTRYPARRRPLIRQTMGSDGMNKTERSFAAFLEALKRSGDIDEWRREPFNFRLADGAFYKPDFMALSQNDGIMIIETKGTYSTGVSYLRWKIAARLNPWFHWAFIKLQNGRIETFESYYEDFPPIFGQNNTNGGVK